MRNRGEGRESRTRGLVWGLILIGMGVVFLLTMYGQLPWDFMSTWWDCNGLKNFPRLNFGKMETAEKCFIGVILTSASYGELLANIAALRKVSNVKFDGGFSKVSGQTGIQAREKLIKELGWTIVDGGYSKPKPAEPQPKPEAANDF